MTELPEQIERYAESLRQELNVHLEIAAETEHTHERLYLEHSARKLEDALAKLHVYTHGAFGTSRDELREARPDPYSITA